MKRPTLIAATYGVMSTPAAAFLSPSSVSTVRAWSHSSPAENSRNGRSPVTAQLSIAIDAPSAPAVPPGKRVVRRRREIAAPAPAIDISNAPVKCIASTADYMDALNHNPNTLVVIKFFAPWCRSCKAMDLKYRRLAHTNKDVQFYEIDVNASPDLKKALGVRAVPTVKIYAGPLGQVVSFSCGPKKVPDLERKIDLCKDVPALAAKVSKGAGMMELVDSEMYGTENDSRKSRLSWSTEQDLRSEPLGIVKGLMEKFARQEQLYTGASHTGAETVSVGFAS